MHEITLSQIQRQVVESAPGKLAFLGGPGAGKSLVVGRRAIRLITDKVAVADHVLVLAPARRAVSALQNHIQYGLRGRRGPWATSFYGLARAIVEEHYRELGYGRPPQILRTAQHRHLLRDLLRKDDPAHWPYSRGSHGRAHEKLAYDVVMGAAQNLLSVEELFARAERWENPELAELAGFYTRGRDHLRRGGLIDMGEVLAGAARLLAEQPAVAESYRLAYRHILVDELEEANHAEFHILAHLVDAQTDLLVVGDPSQAINSYRSGTASHFLACEERLGARILASSENFRSGPRVAAFTLTVRSEFAHPVLCGESASTATTSGGGEEEGYVVLRPFAYPSDEARWVAEEVQSHLRAGVPARQIVILVRRPSAPIVRLIVGELARRGVQAQVQSSRMLIQQPLIRATLDLLRFLSNVHDDQSFLRLLDSPLAGLPPFGLCELQRAFLNLESNSDLNSLSLWERVVATGDSPWRGVRADAAAASHPHLSLEVIAALTSLVERISALQSRIDGDAATLLWEIWRLFPAFHEDALTGGPGSTAYRALLREVSTLDEGHQIKLPELLERLEGGYFEDMRAPLSCGSGVVIATVHQAKGQQWEIVFLPGLIEGGFPLQASSLDFGPLLVRDLDGEMSAGLSAENLNVVLRSLRMAEEERIFHVAVSRARRGLYLSHSRRSADGKSAERPSRFLDQVLACSAVEVVPVSEVGSLPPDVDGAVAYYRRLLRSSDLLERSQSVYALYSLRHQRPDAVCPEEWWENVSPTDGAAPPFPDGRLYLSATRLSSYRNCPLAYQFGHHWSLSEPDGPALTIGSLLHKVLEEYHRPGASHPRTRETLEVLLERHFEAKAFAYKPIARQARKKIAQWLDDYYRHFGQTTSAVAVEQEFLFSLGPHTIRGYIDRIDRLSSGDLELIDYKTGSAMSKNEAKEDLQLALYDLAFYHNDALRALGRPGRASYLYLKEMGVKADGKRSYDPDDDTRTRLRSRVGLYADGIVKELFVPRRSLPQVLPDLDAAEVERARKGSCMFCGFEWICGEVAGE